jgi:hypothetical protein
MDFSCIPSGRLITPIPPFPHFPPARTNATTRHKTAIASPGEWKPCEIERHPFAQSPTGSHEQGATASIPPGRPSPNTRESDQRHADVPTEDARQPAARRRCRTPGIARSTPAGCTRRHDKAICEQSMASLARPSIYTPDQTFRTSLFASLHIRTYPAHPSSTKSRFRDASRCSKLLRTPHKSTNASEMNPNQFQTGHTANIFTTSRRPPGSFRLLS